ncbi:MAG: NAD(P)/FAD-dependent oxidoreductase [Armatimonadota bacterium]|nr:NAD(P)/FAD-dependent oxidoreductase [Armatimonadota bacterium]MDR7603702.1 NAD(P)/FAD-dependent oxidoreductase [Armatimonadota bacterium]
MRGKGGARTVTFSWVRHWLRLADLANQPGAPGVEELVESTWERRVRRREFLRAAGGAALAAVAELLRPTEALAGPQAPRVVIVGAGIAGLVAGYSLRQAGIRPRIYEASTRTGGRMFSVAGAVVPGLVTEFGGEFIDTGHEDMHRLVRSLGLELIDLQHGSEARLRPTFYFDGRRISESEVVRNFQPLARRIRQDQDALGDVVTYRRHTPRARELDRMSVSEYLDRVGASGWVKELLEVAYVAEYGLDAGEQSALNLVLLIGTEPSTTFEVYGDSDERYSVRGGNQQVCDRLALLLQSSLHLGHRLVAVRPRGGGYRLVFERRGAGVVEADADFVILTVPFTLLREVELQVDLPPVKRRAIQELGYGTNSKLILGFRERAWRKADSSGELFTDLPLQTGWDSSRGRPGTAGTYTVFLGGRAGVDVGEGLAREQAQRVLPDLERVFPGVRGAYTGRVARWHWPSDPFVRGSYACWKVGQYTTIAGAEFEPVGRLLFAGEHTSLDYQGYMNGAAQTGRRAAQLVRRLVRR